MNKIREFMRKARGWGHTPMDGRDRLALADIIVELERRIEELEKATNPHRMAGYD